MNWIIPAILGAAGLAVLFVILTDGRYFGKRLMYWVYDRIGPAIFAAQSESDRWHKLAETLDLQGDERILDVGTAVGDLPLSLAASANFHGQIVGIDWSEQMMAAAEQEAQKRRLSDQVKFQVVDIRQGLPFEEGEFDVLVCLGLLETLPRPERILQEMKRVLAADGTMVLSLYQGWASKSVALSMAWYQEHLSAIGLGNLQIAPCRRNHDVVIARASSLSERFRNPVFRLEKGALSRQITG